MLRTLRPSPPARPQLNPFPPAEGSPSGWSSRDAVACRPLHCRPRSPRPGTRGLRTSDPPRLGGAGTGLAAAAAWRAEGGPPSLLLPPGGRGGRGDGGAGAVGPGQRRPQCDPGPRSCWGGSTGLTRGRGARAGAEGSAGERAGLGQRPHPRWGPRVGGRKAGSGGPAGFGFPTSGFPSANDALGALQQKWAPPVLGSARGAR